MTESNGAKEMLQHWRAAAVRKETRSPLSRYEEWRQNKIRPDGSISGEIRLTNQWYQVARQTCTSARRNDRKTNLSAVLLMDMMGKWSVFKFWKFGRKNNCENVWTYRNQLTAARVLPRVSTTLMQHLRGVWILPQKDISKELWSMIMRHTRGHL